MVLQYKGFKNNWVYEEAERITWANVYVGEALNDYRPGGVLYEMLRGDDRTPSDKDALDFAMSMHKAVDEIIRRETATDDDIVYIIGETPFHEMKNVAVVMLDGREKHITYVFTDTAYILNDRGGTVQRIS